MIIKCKYYVECDNDCGEKFICPEKSDLKRCQKIWITYRLKSINPFADHLNSQFPQELHFCSEYCAKEYFEYWNERKDKYELINFK